MTTPNNLPARAKPAPIEWDVRELRDPFVHFEWGFDWARGA